MTSRIVAETKIVAAQAHLSSPEPEIGSPKRSNRHPVFTGNPMVKDVGAVANLVMPQPRRVSTVHQHPLADAFHTQ